MRQLFTSESVTEGHPDKVCDQISDSVLDAILASDPHGRVACETAANTGLVLIMGEITTTACVDYEAIAREAIQRIGYTGGESGFDGASCGIMTSIKKQSPDIAMGVNSALETRGGDTADIGAGDQGMMFGFACNQTEEYMPLPISLAKRLTMRLAEVRKTGRLGFVMPDGKSQVSVEYEDGVAKRIDTVVVSTQHSASVSQETLREGIIEEVIKPILPAHMVDAETKILINPTGRFVIGGPAGDSGLTGRKIIVDTYGGYARHGGGAFSGKDPTKVDRSAAYAARYAAKNIVAAGLASSCEIELAYAIGVAKPVSVFIDTFGTGTVSEEQLSAALCRCFDFRPQAIIDHFALRRPIYAQTASYGPFGRMDLDLPWERLDLADAIKAAL